MKYLLSLSALAALAMAAPSATKSDIGVKVEVVNHTSVKLALTNNGKNDMKFFKEGSLLDKRPLRKVQIKSAKGDEIQFGGLYVSFGSHSLQDTNSFEVLKAGQTLENVFDVAEIYDLSKGGEFSIQANGHLTVADTDGKTTHDISYESNVVKAEFSNVDVAKFKAPFAKRAAHADCGQDRVDILTRGLTDCYTMAAAAQREALFGSSDRLYEYFRRGDDQTRQTVAGVFSRMMDECRHTDDTGSATFHCSDIFGYCSGGAIAYTYGTDIIFCESYYTDQRDAWEPCHVGDRSSVIVHETTHLKRVAGTKDWAYSYEPNQQLPAEKAIDNADAYTYFAHDLQIPGCTSTPDLWQVWVCTDADFHGQCFGVQGQRNTCSGVPYDFNDQVSSLGGSYITDHCYGYTDANCQGEALYISKGNQMNYVGDQFNDRLSSFSCQ